MYSYERGTNLKKYKVSTNNVSGFGSWSKPIVSEIPERGENDRFYIMSLNDFDSDRHYWYNSAAGNLDNIVETNANDFRMGKTNTTTEIENWTNEYYGTQGDNDMWGLIKDNLTKYGKTWFVPSKAEWAAFGDMCWTQVRMTTSTFMDYGLSYYYWTSAQRNNYGAYEADFRNGYIGLNGNANMINSVRLSTTF